MPRLLVTGAPMIDLINQRVGDNNGAGAGPEVATRALRCAAQLRPVAGYLVKPYFP